MKKEIAIIGAGSVKKVINRMDQEWANLFRARGYRPYTYEEVF